MLLSSEGEGMRQKDYTPLYSFMRGEITNAQINSEDILGLEESVNITNPFSRSEDTAVCSGTLKSIDFRLISNAPVLMLERKFLN